MAKRRELVHAKVLHIIQSNWFYWLTVTGKRLVQKRFFFLFSGKTLNP
jgi:hypothetical protein